MNEILNTPTMQIQGVATVIIYMFIGMLIAGIILFFLWQLYRQMTYNYRATLIDKVGNNEIVITDTVKKVEVEGVKLFHYRKLNKYSPIFDSKYLKIFKTISFGMPSSKLGFLGYKYGEKIMPVDVKSNPGIEPIDYDAWNYLTQRLKANQEKYTKRNKLLEMMPYFGLFAVVVAFILGSVLWGQHVENVALEILSKATQIGEKTIQASGGVQVLN